jgi:hypothetical protein
MSGGDGGCGGIDCGGGCGVMVAVHQQAEVQDHL